MTIEGTDGFLFDPLLSSRKRPQFLLKSLIETHFVYLSHFKENISKTSVFNYD
jgi:hypothetical protein